MPTKITTFDSIYKTNYAVVEERRGNLRLYPHTDQLPVILAAINHEFRKHLPHDVARVDRHATEFDKFVLRASARTFCNFFNGSRGDQLQLYPVLDRDLITRLSVVQTVTEHTPRGAIHHFKFYAGPDFYQEFYLAGRRILIVDHCLDRFIERIPQNLGSMLNDFFYLCFSRPFLAIDCNRGVAFVSFTMDNSVIVCPLQDTGSEFILLTTLSAKETRSLRASLPTHHYFLSYDPKHTVSSALNENHRKAMEQRVYAWQRGNLGSSRDNQVEAVMHWRQTAPLIRSMMLGVGHSVETRFQFCGGVIGPCGIALFPGKPVGYDELADYENICPGHDWKGILAERDAQGYRLDQNKICIPYQLNTARILASMNERELDSSMAAALEDSDPQHSEVSPPLILKSEINLGLDLTSKPGFIFSP